MISIAFALLLQDSSGTALKKALDYLETKIDDKGRIAIEGDGVFGNKEAGHVMTTALAGLAFFAADRKAALGKVQAYLKSAAAERLKAKKINGDTWPAALLALFFAHAGDKESLQTCVDFLVEQQSAQGGWSLGNTQGFMTEDNHNLTAAVNLCVIALARAREAGAKVPDEVFERSRSFLDKTLNDRGFFNYMLSRDNGEPPQGRAVAGLLALKSIDQFDATRHAAVVEYARQNLERAASHHVPHIHLFLAAHLYRSLGADDWKKFRDLYFPMMAARQREDGSVKGAVEFNKKFMMSMWTDHHFGPPYATAALALILLTESGKIRLIPQNREY